MLAQHFLIILMTCTLSQAFCHCPSYPLTLHDLLDTALQNNPRTQIAWADIKQAAATLRISESTLYPTVDYRYDHIYRNEKTVYRIPDQIDLLRGLSREARSTLMISYLLLDFGGRMQTIESSYQALISMRWRFEQTLQAVMLDTLLAYYQYTKNKMLWKASVLDVRDAEKSLEAVKIKQAAGYALITDLLQTKSTLLTTQQTENTLRNQMVIAKGNLSSVLGWPANSSFEVEDWQHEEFPVFVKNDIDNLVELALDTRPELMARRADYFQKEAAWRATQSAGKPTLQFRSNLTHVDYLKTSIRWQRDYTCGLSVEVPLFHGFFYMNQTRRAAAERDRALASLEEAELAAMNEVWSSFYTLRAASENYSFARENIRVAEESYRVTLEGYQLGSKEVTDLLLAQSQLSSARQALIDVEASWKSSLSSLAYALGVLGIGYESSDPNECET